VRVRYTVMHGCGNAYAFVDLRGHPEDEHRRVWPEMANSMGDKHTGLGVDGLILVCRARSQAHARMRIFNADGSEAEMCGNGIRCLARLVLDHDPPSEGDLLVETLAGTRRLSRSPIGFVVEMGAPAVGPDQAWVDGAHASRVDALAIRPNGADHDVLPVLVGNPHAVLFVEDVNALDVSRVGPAIERHPAFREGANVECVQVTGPDALRLRTWERGSGITQACGTGACAAAIAAITIGRIDNERVVVHADGGTLVVRWDRTGGGRVTLEGPTEYVAQGEWGVE